LDFDAVDFDVFLGRAGESSIGDVKADKFFNCGVDEGWVSPEFLLEILVL
jgi:hypothetical protein